MADTTNIEWADSTFNPFIGCTKISPACDNCYAEALMDKRMNRVKWGAGQPRVRTSAGNWKKPLQWNRAEFFECEDCGWRGEYKYHECSGACRLKPVRRRVFCASLADVFDNEVDPAWRRDLFDLIGATPNLDWLLLTKRIGNVRKMVSDATLFDFMPRNVWIGATICNQEEADRDIPKLLAVPADVRFVSIEPLLGPINLNRSLPFSVSHGLTEPSSGIFFGGIHWVIVGGESGPEARPMHPDWVRGLRDQCAAAGVPFLMKQWGEWAPREPYASEQMESDELCGKWDGISYRYGKKAAGRLLDGVTHTEYPTKGAV